MSRGGNVNREKIKQFFAGKTVRIVLIALVAALLAFAVWRVFFGTKSASAEYRATEQEARLALILSGIEGVGTARVMIGEEDGVPVSAVVVFEGEDTLMTRLRVAEVTANLLSIGRDKVAAYHAA